MSPETFILYSLIGFSVATLFLVAAGCLCIWKNKGKQSK